jgi:hypothetical protein
MFKILLRANELQIVEQKVILQKVIRMMTVTIDNCSTVVTYATVGNKK